MGPARCIQGRSRRLRFVFGPLAAKLGGGAFSGISERSRTVSVPRSQNSDFSVGWVVREREDGGETGRARPNSTRAARGLQGEQVAGGKVQPSPFARTPKFFSTTLSEALALRAGPGLSGGVGGVKPRRTRLVRRAAARSRPHDDEGGGKGPQGATGQRKGPGAPPRAQQGHGTPN